MNTKATLSAALLAATLLPATADVTLSKVFGNHMVLQRDKPIRIWGKADPGESVALKLASADGSQESKGAGKASDDGKWRIDLPALKSEGKTLTLTVTGKNELTVSDILMGEVWICSGQSNMEWPVRISDHPEREIKNAKHPQIRLFNVPGHVAKPEPDDDPRGTWQLCSPDTIPGFSAVGYSFGRELHQKLKVPIGLVGTNWGGTRIEPWTPVVGFEQVPNLKDYVENLKAVAEARKNGGKGKPKGGAVQIYNGMVHALTPLSVRGAIWYQGESNAGDGLRYDYLKEALVKGWRTVFENDELSFYWVQLANFRKPENKPEGGGWGPVREGQKRALRVPNTGMAVIIDIGAPHDIHPRNKQDVGRRLSLWALAKNYGKDIVYSGPLYKGMKVEGSKVRVSFDHVGSGLMVGRKDGHAPTVEVHGAPLSHFSLQDEDGKWHWASAKIDGETVVVWSDDVAKPTNVRLGYESNPACFNLYNKEGLPASPFTSVD